MLIFDIGGNRGAFADCYNSPKNTVVILEANSSLATFLKHKYQNYSNVHVLPLAVSDKLGRSTFYISNADTISTLSKDWVDNSRFTGSYSWQPVEVETVTLDYLINLYGKPDFLKIDTEGAELEVVMGLSTKVPLLAFEFAEESKDKILLTVKRLQEIGFTEFGYTWADSYTERPAKYSSWEDLGLEEQLIPERKDKWGMIYCKP